jgi:phosphopantothenoylcysteine decarboxylase / phosphopantothenate---cysteine ligase
MLIALLSGSGVGCGALPAVIAALRRRGWSVVPTFLPATEPCLGPGLLRDLCGVAPVAIADLPAADVMLVAPCDAALQARLADTLAGAPHLPSRVVVADVAPGPASAGATGAEPLPGLPAWHVVPARDPVLGGGVAELFMGSPQAVCETVAASVTPQSLTGAAVLVTAGPTCEDLDPVRFLTNRSTGLMGVALALAAWRRGAGVTLVHGPLRHDVPCLPRLEPVPVRSAEEMYAAVLSRSAAQAVAILCAAVADFRPAHREVRKIKKGQGADRVLELVATPDILAALGAAPTRPFLVGFAAETHDLHANAAAKLRRKNCDLLCANDVTEPGSGFGVATNRISLLARDGSVTLLPLLPKDDAADLVLERVVAELARPRLSP